MRVKSIRTCLFVLCVAAVLAGGCGGIHRYDERQVPVVSVSGGLRPVVSWTPVEAYELNVYAGTEDGNGFGVLWTLRGSGRYENDLCSPVTFGVPPPGSAFGGAAPLEPGKTYTVVVVRKDSKGGGDGFFNTRHRYAGTTTFVAGR